MNSCSELLKKKPGNPKLSLNPKPGKPEHGVGFRPLGLKGVFAFLFVAPFPLAVVLTFGMDLRGLGLMAKVKWFNPGFSILVSVFVHVRILAQ